MTTVPSFPSLTGPSYWRGFLARVALMGGVWFGLTGADWKSWVIGGPLAVTAAWASMRLLSAIPWHWSVRGAFGFGAFFLRESWRGGWDVAWRALTPRLALSPAIIHYAVRLPVGPARLFFCGAISLLPGTAVVAIEEKHLLIHVLDRSSRVEDELRELESRVALLFDLELREQKGAT